MVEHKAKVVLSSEVSNMIEYMTKNLTTEIGALGTVSVRSENKKKYFYVEKLFFPKQEVTGASVKIRSAMYKDIMKQASLKELGKLNFYWHRHPGSAAHSHTDEEDTFGAFMGKTDKRKYFIFMQSAKPYGKDEIEFETRIDIRIPIRTTILNDNIDIIQEYSDAEGEIVGEIEKLQKKLDSFKEKEKAYLKEKADKIYKECIIKPKPLYYGKGFSKKSNNNFSIYNIQPKKQTFFFKGVDDKVVSELKNYFVIDYEKSKINNRFLTQDAEKEVYVQLSNGNVEITFGKEFGKYLERGLENGGFLKKLIKKEKKLVKDSLLKTVRLQPKKKMFLQLKSAVLSLFLVYNRKLYKKDQQTITMVGDDAKFSINGGNKVRKVLNFLYDKYVVEWEGKQMIVSDDKGIVGVAKMTDGVNSIKTNDKNLIEVIEPISKESFKKSPFINSFGEPVYTDDSDDKYFNGWSMYI